MLKCIKVCFGYLCGSGKLYQSSFNHLKIWWGEIEVDKAKTMVGWADAPAPLTAHELYHCYHCF